MKKEDIPRLANSIRNKTIKQLESANSYKLVFLEEDTSSIISMNKSFYANILSINYQHYISSYDISQEPYLVSGYKFYVLDHEELPF